MIAKKNVDYNCTMHVREKIILTGSRYIYLAGGLFMIKFINSC